MKIRRSSYYAWKRRKPGVQAIEDELMKRMIEPVFNESKRTYGSRRLKASLEQTGIKTSRRRVSRLMKAAGMVPKQVEKWHPQTTKAAEKHEKAPNLLDQDFTAEHPDQKWVVDITYIATKEGWLYLAVILDLYSRAVVGWSMQSRMSKALVIAAWEMACSWRHPPKELLHHSDQGSQYTSKTYLKLLRDKNCRISMSGKGNCYDNACMESFFSSLKIECSDGVYKNREEARLSIFEYIETWYNRKRLHSTLGYLSPLEYEEIRGARVQ